MSGGDKIFSDRLRLSSASQPKTMANPYVFELEECKDISGTFRKIQSHFSEMTCPLLERRWASSGEAFGMSLSVDEEYRSSLDLPAVQKCVDNYC